jgi:hypothetical protein
MCSGAYKKFDVACICACDPGSRVMKYFHRIPIVFENEAAVSFISEQCLHVP